jgi:uncharacterized delta-60 repeat protein
VRDRPSRIALVATLATLAIAPALAASGDPGTPDPSFGSGGFAFDGDASDGGRMALDAQGRTIVAGTTPNTLPAVGRFTAAGVLDTSFAAGESTPGTAVLDNGSGTATSVAALTDGAYAVRVESFAFRASIPSDADVVRLTSAGVLDTGFGGGDGAIATGAAAKAVAAAPAGGVFAAGQSGSQFQLMEFSAAGNPVTGFGTGGVALSANILGTMTATDVEVGADGAILVAGLFSGDSSYAAAVARFTPGGQPDSSFDGDGLALIPTSSPCTDYITATALAVDAQRRVLLGTYSYHDTGSGFVYCSTVERLRPDGVLDPAYDGDLGQPYVSVNDLAVQPDGSALAIGALDPAGAVFALDPAGKPDAAFAPGPQRPGLRTVQAGPSGSTTLYGGALLDDGRLALSGSGTNPQDIIRMMAARLFVDAAPVAGLTGPASAAAGETVTFTSTSTDNGPLQHAWDLDGDGTFETSTGATPSAARSYDTGGTRTVRLRVTDAKGRTATAAHAIAVSVPPQATPTATPTPSPVVPVEGKTIVAGPVKGTVRYKVPGASSFKTLTPNEPLPLGTEFDTRKGHVAIIADDNGKPETVELWNWFFRSAQVAGSAPVFTATLTRGSFKSCRKSKKKKATTAASKKRVRRLFGSGKGRFRTKGRYSAATVRGTRWSVEDRCDGTVTRVTSGTVSVRDPRRKTTRAIRRGRTYLVKAP